MVRDMVTGLPWTPDTAFVRDMYNLGRYVDDTKAEKFPETTSQGERESEFDRWLAGVQASGLPSELTDEDRDDFAAAAHSRYFPRGLDGERISGRSPLAMIFIKGAEYGALYARKVQSSDNE